MFSCSYEIFFVKAIFHKIKMKTHFSQFSHMTRHEDLMELLPFGKKEHAIRAIVRRETIERGENLALTA